MKSSIGFWDSSKISLTYILEFHAYSHSFAVDIGILNLCMVGEV